jgi:GNAT superfamily N-acetyltransferase
VVSAGLREVYPGTSREVRPVVRTILEAFDQIAVSRWLCPDDRERERVLGSYFALHVRHALRHGSVDYLPGYTGVGVWLGSPCPPIPDYESHRDTLTGRWADRFRALDAVMDARHPDRPHCYLAFLAVRPGHQGHGLGSTLLAHRQAVLDVTGTPAYLEAADPRSRNLYLRRGYADCGAPLDLPVAPSLTPMWREPRPGDVRQEGPPLSG